MSHIMTSSLSYHYYYHITSHYTPHNHDAGNLCLKLYLLSPSLSTDPFVFMPYLRVSHPIIHKKSLNLIGRLLFLPSTVVGIGVGLPMAGFFYFFIWVDTHRR